MRRSRHFDKANDPSGLSLACSGKKDFDTAIEYAKKANDLSALANAYCGKNDFDTGIKYFEQANDLSGLSFAWCGKRQYDKAIEYARKANDLSALGHAYCGKKDYDKAIQYFTQANDASGLSAAYSAKHEYDKAIQYALAANDKSALGHAYCGKKEYDKATDYFQQANDNSGLSLAWCGKREFDTGLNLASSANDLSAQGHAWCGKRDFDAGISCFQQANDLSGLSYAYSEKRDYDTAIEYAQKANDLSALGHAYCGKKEYDKAIEYFKKANDDSGLSLAYCGKNLADTALTYSQKANDASAAGFAYLRRHEYRKAIENFTKANDKGGLSLVYAQQKEYETALRLAQEINDLSLQGNVYLGLGDLKQAETCFSQANDLSGLGFVRFNRHKYSEALKLFEQANDLPGQGFVYSKRGEYEKAEQCFKQANDNSGLGKLALKTCRYKEAIEYFSKANDYDGLGDVYFRLRHFDKAAEMFRKEGNEVKAVQALAKKHEDGREEALTYARNMIEEGKFIPAMYIEIGKILAQEKKYDESITELEKVLGGGSYYTAEALMLIARAQYLQRKYEDAEDTFTRLANEYPTSEYAVTAQNGLKAIATLETIAKQKQEKDKKRLQQQIILTDKNRCGPDSLKMLLEGYGIETTAEEIAKLADTDKEGTTMLGLQKAAEQKGIKLTALKLTKEELSAYNEKAIILIDGNHYVLVTDKDEKGIIITDNFKEEKITYDELVKRWRGETLAVRQRNEGEKLALSQIATLKGGNQRRCSEGFITKGDPAVLPNGDWDVEYGKLGANVPQDYLTITHTDGNGLGDGPSLSPHKDDGLSVNSLGTTSAAPTAGGGSQQSPASSGSGNGNVATGGLNCKTSTDPVAVTGGQVILPFEDIVIPGRGRNNGMELLFSRTYSSRSDVLGILGFGWYVSFLATLEEIDNQTIVITKPDGMKFSYIDQTGSGIYEGAAFDASFVGKDANGYFVWHCWTSMYGWQYYHFDAGNRLSSIEDKNGNKLTYAYNTYNQITSITDDSGRALVFTYENGRISKVTAPLGVEYNYYYDGNNNLFRVTGPENYEVEYEYNP